MTSNSELYGGAGSLLWLLHPSSLLPSHVPSQVCGIVRLLRQPLGSLPYLPRNRWSILVGESCIDPSCSLCYGTLVELALRISCSEENRVDDKENPAALRKGDGREQDTGPQRDLKQCDKRHGGVVVFLHKLADAVCERGRAAGRSWGGRRAWGRLRRGLGWLQGWKKVRSGVGRDVEDGVDGER